MDYRTWPTYSLREVGTIVTGSTPSTKDPENYSFEDYCFIKPSDISSSGITEIKDSEFHISRKAFSQSRRLPAGSVLTTCIGIIGKVGILQKEATCNQQINALIPNRGFDPSFLAYAILSKKTELQELANAPVVPIINKKTFSELRLRIPELPVQLSIAKELNLLAEIIDKKNAQLRDLDALAQSIFYEMFGDPVTNEKGWPTAQLSSVSTLLNGRAYKQDELLNTGKYRVLRVGNFFTNSNYYYSDLELEDDKYCDNGDLLFAWSASFGAFIWSGEKVIYHYHIWKVLFDNARLNKEFYRFLLNTMTSSFLNDVHGIGMVHLTKAGMEQYVLPIPPMEKQEEFANKIASIEKQRTVIQASLDGANQLLTSRMSFYFE